MGKDEARLLSQSCSSSIETNSSTSSSSQPPCMISSSSSSSSLAAAVSNNNERRRDLMSTCADLNLGLSIALSPSPPPPTSKNNNIIGVTISTTTSYQKIREQRRRLDWPPIKPLLRSTLNKLAEKADENDDDDDDHPQQYGSLFVKVYMEGIPIGRKLDLFAHHGYNALITTLSHMFTIKATNILCPDDSDDHGRVVHSSAKHYQYVLTYQDKEGDWMMVGDVPWEVFLTAVKRLKITRAGAWQVS